MADSMSTTTAATPGLGGTFTTLIDILKYGVPGLGGLVVLVLILIWCCRFWKGVFTDPDEVNVYEEDKLMEGKNEWDDISVLGVRDTNYFGNISKRRASDASEYFMDIDEGLPDDSFNVKLLGNTSYSIDSGQGASSGSVTPNRSWKRTKSMTESIEMLDLADVHYSSNGNSTTGSRTSLNKDRSGSIDSAMDDAIQLSPAKLSQEKLNHVIDMDKWAPPAYERVCSVRSYADVDTMSLSSYKIALTEGAMMTPFLGRREFNYGEAGDMSSLKRIKAYNMEAIKEGPYIVRQSSQVIEKVPIFPEPPMTPFNDRKEINSLYQVSDADDTDTESTQKSVRVMAEIYSQGKPILSARGGEKPDKAVKLQNKQEIATITTYAQQDSAINQADSHVRTKSRQIEKVQRSSSFKSNGSIAHIHDKSEDSIVSLPMSSEEKLKATRRYQRQQSSNDDYYIDTPRRPYFASDSSDSEKEEKGATSKKQDDHPLVHSPSYFVNTPRRPYFASDSSDSEKEEKKAEPYFPKSLKKKGTGRWRV